MIRFDVEYKLQDSISKNSTHQVLLKLKKKIEYISK